MNRIVLLIAGWICAATLSASTWQFRVWFADKPDDGRPAAPESVLSPRSLERRARSHVVFDTADRPVSRRYIESVLATGVTLDVTSRWMNTIVVSAADSAAVFAIRSLPGVRRVEWVGRRTGTETPVAYACPEPLSGAIFPSVYGAAAGQMEQVRGDFLHVSGYRGAGMSIALLDAGFQGVDSLPLRSSETIAGRRDFIFPPADTSSGYPHGRYVFSVLAACDSGTFVGSAPDARYWLLRCENPDSEQPVEEDFWVAALEFADSAGVDVVNSSVGYTRFDIPARGHTPRRSEGKGTFISRAAAVAAQKGMLIVVSAGNEGRSDWEEITFPADAPGVLSVGGVDASGEAAPFTGRGFVRRRHVKPDVAARAAGSVVLTPVGPARLDGTSFAAPLVAGLAAALWQAFPDRTAQEILTLIRESASCRERPDDRRGYGVPDFSRACRMAAGNRSR